MLFFIWCRCWLCCVVILFLRILFDCIHFGTHDCVIQYIWADWSILALRIVRTFSQLIVYTRSRGTNFFAPEYLSPDNFLAVSQCSHAVGWPTGRVSDLEKPAAENPERSTLRTWVRSSMLNVLGFPQQVFTCLLHIITYARLQVFIQLPATLTKLCHPIHIMCSKCPPSADTQAAWSHLIWHDFVTVGDNWIKICSLV